MFIKAHKNKLSINCDRNFNPKDKVNLESQLSRMVIEDYLWLFSTSINKVFKLIEPDLVRILKNDANHHPIDTELYLSLFNDFHIAKFIPPVSIDEFSATLLNKLQENSTSAVFIQMILIRIYLIFFISKGEPKEAYYTAIKTKWSSLNFEKLLNDVVLFRGNHFKNNRRVNRSNSNYIRNVYGIFAQEDADKGNMSIFPHDCGSLRYRITSIGQFTSQTMFKYHMPALCGPSGMVAMYLALANQATNLSIQEKMRFNFVMCFLTIYVGGHSLDECFSIGINQYNQYRRGNYYSILHGIELDKACIDALTQELDSCLKQKTTKIPASKSFQSFV